MLEAAAGGTQRELTETTWLPSVMEAAWPGSTVFLGKRDEEQWRWERNLQML